MAWRHVARGALGAVALAAVALPLFVHAGQIPSASDRWLPASRDYAWSFPRDHGPHPGYKTEWWYFTGLLSQPDPSEPHLGYQFTIFRIGVVPDPPASSSPWATPDLLMGHMAITDLAAGTHLFREVLYRAAPPLARFGAPGDSLIAWSLAPPGTEGQWTLARTEDGFRISGVAEGTALELALRPSSPLVFQGPGGYSPKSDEPGRASMYYSFTDLATDGAVTVGDRTRTVTGTTWMDHEFSSEPLGEDQVGWDWFSIRLDDGRRLMAFQLRDRAGVADFEQLTLVEADDTVTWVAGGGWSLEPGATWTSPETGASYPVEWHLRVPEHGLDLTASAILAAQENVSAQVPGLYYWEGAIRLTASDGTAVGRGYLEMTGYGEGSRPAL